VRISQNPSVAVLLTTHNGNQYIKPQVRSLKDNCTRFSLHWLDDQSVDATRETVRATAFATGIQLHEYHQSVRQGFPGSFFHLIEAVEADIYMFCDQDDIWQPGKIDATVQNIRADLHSPVLCFSECLIFRNAEPGILFPFSHASRVSVAKSLEESRSFILVPGLGHTMGFTRALRDLYLRDAIVAREYAFGHDTWMYILAVAAGAARMLYGVPTTLYRRHESNTTSGQVTRGGKAIVNWQLIQGMRKGSARQARGFLRASASLPSSRTLGRMIQRAEIVSGLDRRHSGPELARVLMGRVLYPNAWIGARMALACLSSDATADSGVLRTN